VTSSQRRRWGVLLTALALTLAAILFSPAPAEVVEVSDRRVPVPVGAPAAQPSITQMAATFEEEASADPFEKRGWAEPPPPAAPLAEPAPVERTVAPVVVEPVGPPPLPFRYVGSFSDDAGAVIYLARGEVAVVARVGETLDGTYKVAALQARSVEFEHISTGTKQSLPIPEAE
jgi:hypothetical protein